LELWRHQISNNNFVHFPSCQSLISEGHNIENIEKFLIKISKLSENFNNRFVDFRKHKKLFDILTNPFTIDYKEVDNNIQMELIELQCDSFLKSMFNECDSIEFLRLLPNRFIKLRLTFAKIISMFGNTYLCEQLFSKMKLTKNKNRNSLTKEHLTSSLRVNSANEVKPDINILLSNIRAQVSSQTKNL
jgi:hypothetical protein